MISNKTDRSLQITAQLCRLCLTSSACRNKTAGCEHCLTTLTYHCLLATITIYKAITKVTNLGDSRQKTRRPCHPACSARQMLHQQTGCPWPVGKCLAASCLFFAGPALPSPSCHPQSPAQFGHEEPEQEWICLPSIIVLTLILGFSIH